MLKALGAGGMMLAGGASMASAKSHKTVGKLDILYEFEPYQGPPTEPPFGELPENVAVDKRGNKYVSVPSQGQIWKFSPDNEPVDPPFVQFDTGDTFLVGPTGLEVDPQGTLYVCFASDFSSNGADTNGVWTVDEDGTKTPFAEISTGTLTFPNDIALFGDSLLVTDSFTGVVWQVREGTKSVWADDPLLKPAVSPPPGPGAPGSFGANGIALSKDKETVYVSNNATGKIIAIPVNNDGTAGTPTEYFSGVVAPDGLALDTRGNLYVADNVANQIVRISPDQTAVPLVSGSPLDFPADVTFGTSGGEQKSVFIVNLAFSAAYPTFMKLDVGVPGLPIRR
jgi:sugar lactone lactonase YvrE